MTQYYQPVPRSDPYRSSDAVTLAGGWLWFDQVLVLSRDAAPRMCGIGDIPAGVVDRLTRPRGPIAGRDMGQPQVMGILNVTPDSFSDGGQFADHDVAVTHALAMQAAGAAIIDIGGESTRPGAKTVAIEDEIARTAPVIAAIRAASDVPISIDTRKAKVADAAIAAGASLVNDVAALTFDPDMAGVAAAAALPVCLMHAQGDPATMQAAPFYDNVLLDVYDFLSARVDAAVAAGIARERIVVDPGIGFGKTLQHNVTLMRGLSLFHGLGCPVLLGASRKRFIGTLGSADDAVDRVGGSVSVALFGAMQGVQLLRVHDTFETRQALSLQMALIGTGSDG